MPSKIGIFIGVDLCAMVILILLQSNQAADQPAVTLTWPIYANTLGCKAEGFQASFSVDALTHSFNGVSIRKLDGTIVGNALYYTFHTFSYMDRGLYTCEVRNGTRQSGDSNISISSDILIKPSDGPKFVTYEDNYSVSKEDSISIQFTVYAYPHINISGVSLFYNSSESISDANIQITVTSYPVSLKFYNKTVNTTDGQLVTVTIGSVTESYFGKPFYLNLQNGHGTDSRNFTIHPEGPPDPPEDLQITHRAHDAVTLTFRSGFFNGANQTFVVEFKEQTGSQWFNGSSVAAGTRKNITLSTNIGGLDSSTLYIFRSYSYNIYAKSDYASITTTTLKAPLPLAAIISGCVGGTLVVVMVIVGVLVNCRSRHRKTKEIHNSMHISRGQIKEQGGAHPVAMEECLEPKISKSANIEKASMTTEKPCNPARQPEEEAYIDLDVWEPQYMNVGENGAILDDHGYIVVSPK